MQITFDVLGTPLSGFQDAKKSGAGKVSKSFAPKNDGTSKKSVQARAGAPAFKGRVTTGIPTVPDEDDDTDDLDKKAKDKIGPIKKGALHKQMGVPQGKKMPKGRMNKMASKLHKKAKGDKKLSAKELQTSRRLNFAKVARGWSHK